MIKAYIKRRKVRQIIDVIYRDGSAADLEYCINKYGISCNCPTPVVNGKMVSPAYKVGGITVYRDGGKRREYLGVAYGNVCKILDYPKTPVWSKGTYKGWTL